jgi:WhiB family transcriptional regulator, redox-sensing transcriptional regulator
VPIGDVTELWFREALCRGSNVFAATTREPVAQRRAREQTAKRICADCPVRRLCLDYALRVREPLGIWGGKTESERRTLQDQLLKRVS